MNSPIDLSQPIAAAQGILAQLGAGTITSDQARSSLMATIPATNTATAQEAAEILAPHAANFSNEARGEMLKLLMEDRSGGETLLQTLRVEAAAPAENQATREEASEILSKHHLFGEASRVVGRLLEKDKAAGLRLIEGMPELPKPKKSDLPPPPQHDPASWGTAASKEGRIRQSEELIKEIKAEGKFTDYTSAHNEARRRAPGLFS